MITERHTAMATEFRITIAHQDERYARQAAVEVLCELEHLESLLSRFVEGSDVARIGRGAAGESLPIAPDTYDCLQAALRMESDTDGAFNIAYRHQPPRRCADLLELAEPPPRARMRAARVPLDLGGIAKGFVLDRLAAVLAEWELNSFLLRASFSTLLAAAPPPGSEGWPVAFGPATDRRSWQLRHAAISGSGTAVKGSHIVDPRSGLPATHHRMTWAAARTAADADALSTALMVMDPTSIAAFRQHHPEYWTYVLPAGSSRVHPPNEPLRRIYR